MDTHDFSEWLGSLSAVQRTQVFIRMYSTLTVYTRELFLPDVPAEKKQAAMHMLHGINELHHTLANRLGRDLRDKDWPLSNFVEQLQQIAEEFQLRGYLAGVMKQVWTYFAGDPKR